MIKELPIILITFLFQLNCQGVFLDEDQVSGFIPINESDDIFYWLFKSRNSPESAPLVIWLTGGPGCASELAVFYENGPFTINDDLTLKKNPDSWNN
jgi:cathepsin A (carboxypeptidase C)